MKDRIRIRLKAHDSYLLEQSAGEIAEAVGRTGASIRKPFSNGVDNFYQVLRSPQSNGTSWTHKRLLDIFEPSQATIDALMNLDLPEDVRVEVRSFPRHVSDKATRPASHPKSAEVELVNRALHVLGSPAAVVRWMKTPIPALYGQTPYSLLDSVEGRTQVETVLGRIEHGIF